VARHYFREHLPPSHADAIAFSSYCGAGRNRSLARAVDLSHVGESRVKPRRGLVEDQRGRNGLQLFEPLPPRATLRRQKACKQECVGRQAGAGQRGERSRRAWHARHLKPSLKSFAHELVARI